MRLNAVGQVAINGTRFEALRFEQGVLCDMSAIYHPLPGKRLPAIAERGLTMHLPSRRGLSGPCSSHAAFAASHAVPFVSST